MKEGMDGWMGKGKGREKRKEGKEERNDEGNAIRMEDEKGREGLRIFSFTRLFNMLQKMSVS